MKQITFKEWFKLTAEEREEVVKTLGEVIITFPKKWHSDLRLEFDAELAEGRYEGGYWCEFTGKLPKKYGQLFGPYKFQVVYTMLKGPEWMIQSIEREYFLDD